MLFSSITSSTSKLESSASPYLTALELCLRYNMHVSDRLQKSPLFRLAKKDIWANKTYVATLVLLSELEWAVTVWKCKNPFMVFNVTYVYLKKNKEEDFSLETRSWPIGEKSLIGIEE